MRDRFKMDDLANPPGIASVFRQYMSHKGREMRERWIKRMWTGGMESEKKINSANMSGGFFSSEIDGRTKEANKIVGRVCPCEQ